MSRALIIGSALILGLLLCGCLGGGSSSSSAPTTSAYITPPSPTITPSGPGAGTAFNSSAGANTNPLGNFTEPTTSDAASDNSSSTDGAVIGGSQNDSQSQPGGLPADNGISGSDTG